MTKFLKLLRFEKRAILVLFIVVITLLVSIFGHQTSALESPFTSPLGDRSKFENASSKLKGDNLWKPVGWGSGEYLTSIPIINAGAVLDLESGNVLWSLNLEKRIAPASLTKLATLMTAYDLTDGGHILYVSDNASSQIPTKLGLKSGERMTLDEAASAAVMTSANDATEAISDSLGREIGDGTSTFEDLVNAKLAKLGAVHSHFVTSTGLDDDNHYSSVFDLAILGHEVWKNYPFIKDTASLPYKRLVADQNHAMFDLPNWNALLGTYPGVNGLKIGYTENAGHSTMVTATKNGVSLMAIVVGAKSLEDREISAATLLNYGFSQRGIKPYPIAKLDLVSRFNDWKKELSSGGP